MKFEHFALNVPDPVAMAGWYVEHCGMRVVLCLDEAPHTHFLADEGGRTVMEIYSNPAAPLPEYAAQPPLLFHFAFAVADAAAVRDRLLAAGASLEVEQRLDDDSHLVMLRDPWGVPLQLCNRATPLG